MTAAQSVRPTLEDMAAFRGERYLIVSRELGLEGTAECIECSGHAR
jgi:hypothetical protein